MARGAREDYLLLVRVRRSVRALNAAIERGAAEAELTRQQQGLLLAVLAFGGKDVPFSRARRELGMDRATASILLARLVELGLISNEEGTDRRALHVSLTPRGRTRVVRSVGAIHRELSAADRRGELASLERDLRPYLSARPRAR